MDKTEAVREAAEAALEHGGPECRTDPVIPLDAMLRAYHAGATPDDIRAEMARQRQD
ncbi:hypothetical protein ACFXCZ_27185 [Streptomyces sp. NPDC059396]|uniref:hypothetical protein n=1 Tax=Streptomyces sp. NPDC059396 TaxID=3346819 RepID=UPI0036A26F34